MTRDTYLSMLQLKVNRLWVFACLISYLMSAFANANENIPMKSIQLAPCPNSPNCVSSLAKNKEHKIDPIDYRGSSQDAFKRIKTILLEMPGTRLVTENSDYIHVEFRTRLLGFLDDVEAQLNAQKNTIEIRSASRTGFWDFGTNKKRIDLIRKHFYRTTE